MYRIYISLGLLLALGQWLWAGPVDRQRASELAARFVHVDARAEALRAAEQARGGVVPAYHIFNDTDRSGFVILSGEEGAPPILGYSEVGQLQQGRLPEQLAGLLGLYEQRVRELRRAGQQGSPGQSQSIKVYRPRPIVGPLLTCEWNQAEPYNDLAPQKAGEDRAPIGCVATAMAQVMYFHQWPATGKGKRTYNNAHYGELSADFSKSTYRWSDMTPTYKRTRFGTPTWEAKAGAAVARLMYDAAVSVSMQFTPSESGAFTHDAASALDTNFDYHVRYLTRDAMNNVEFVSGIKDELNSGNPILMTGASTGGGHAWVLDGYDENGLIHVNWGWGGVSNGYFELDFMNPPSLGIGGGAGHFNQEQQVILARPRREGATLPERIQGRFSLFGEGMYVDDSRSDLAGGSVVFGIPDMGNWLTPRFKGEFGVGLYAPSGELLHSFSSYPVGEVSRRTYFTSDQRVSVYLTAAQRDLVGRYYFAPISREQRLKSPNANPNAESSWEVVGEWLPMAHSNRIEVELNKGAITVLTDGNTPHFVLTAAPEVLTLAWLSRKGSLRASIKNTSFVTLQGNVALALESVGLTPVVRDTLSLDEMIFYDYTTVDRPLVFDTKGNQRLKEGKYRVSFCVIKPEETYLDEQNKPQVDPREVFTVENPFGPFEIELLKPSNSPIVEYYTTTNYNTSYSLELFRDGKPHESDVLTLEEAKVGQWQIGISLRNYGVGIQTPVRYRLRDMVSGALIDLGTSANVWLRSSIVSNMLTRADIDFSTINLVEGRTYRILAEVKVADKWVDVWNGDVPRRYLFVRKAEAAGNASGQGGNTTDQNGNAVEGIAQARPVLYPNPARAALHLTAEGIESLEVYDMAGRRVLSHEPTSGGAVVDISRLPAGLYIATLRASSGQAWTERLIVR